MASPWSKEQREAHVAKSLCRALGPDWKLVGTRSPPYPDCLIDGPRGEVAVELVGYRQRGEVNTLWERDEQFRSHIEEQVGQVAAMPGVAVQFQYRTRKGERYARIPRKSHYAGIIAEVVDLVRHARSLSDISAEFSFVETARADLRVGNGRRDHAQWITSRYPVLGEWFTAVDVRFYLSIGISRASTAFQTMWVGLDEDELARAIGTHVNRIGGYRQATSAPIWLVVYSGVYPVSTSFPSLQPEQAIAAARRAARRDEADVFDGVLWLDGPNSTADPSLWGVQQPKLLTELGITLGVPRSPLESLWKPSNP